MEIDLVRSGSRVLSVPERHFPSEWRNCAQACIWRNWRDPHREYYGFPLRERLPALAIPLRPHEKPAPLDLQSLLDERYRTGRYETIDGSKPPDPPRNAEDAAWAKDVISASGRPGPAA